MKLPEVVELVENHPDLHLYLDKILKKNKKTQVSYLESLNHLAYLLYLDGQEEMAKELLDRIIQVPFEGNGYDWASLALVFLEEKMPELSDAIDFDPEGSMFCAYSSKVDALAKFALEFKEFCDDIEAMKDLFSRAELD